MKNWQYSSCLLPVTLCLLAAGGGLRQAVEPQMGAPPALSWEDRERLEESATASLFGELRGGIADFLWLKADRLVHNGVETRALTNTEKRSHERHHASEAHGEETPVARCEEGTTTVVPNQEADHRGILGDLERQIKPYMDMRNHHHRDPGETAALFRLMTWANPRFIPGWVIGANVLGEDLDRPREAITFLEQGAKHNPWNVEIQVELGRFHLYHLQNPPTAERHFQRAIALGEEQPKLSEDEAEAWETAHRWLVIQYHNLGRSREARKVARIAIQRFPESGYFRRALAREEEGNRES
jgi:tetratricopeptide (TPR) repeat protein